MLTWFRSASVLGVLLIGLCVNACGESLFQVFSDNDSEAAKFELLQQEFEKDSPDYDVAITLADEVIAINAQPPIYYQLKATAVLGKHQYDMFTILQRSVNQMTRTTTAANSAPLVEGQTTAVGGVNVLFDAVASILPSPDNVNTYTALYTALDVLDLSASDAGTEALKSLVKALVIIQALRSLADDFNLTNFNPANVTQETLESALTNINRMLVLTADANDMVSTTVNEIVGNIDKGSCTDADDANAVATQNGMIEACELTSCATSVTTVSAGCFE